MTPVVEAKVAWPAVVVACASVLAAACYRLALSYGFDPTSAQNTALIGLGAALQYVLYVVTGYFAPHTSRPDLTPTPVVSNGSGLLVTNPVPGSQPDGTGMADPAPVTAPTTV